MSGRTPSGKIEVLGAAHRGTEHFARQRATAIALVPLSIWFAWFALAMIGAEQSDAAAFLAQPVNAVLMALFVIVSLYHMVLGVQMVVEDYIGRESTKVILLLMNKLFAWLVGAAAIYALLKIAVLKA